MMYVSIVLGLVALIALTAILVKLSSILMENVDRIMAKLAYMHILLQAVDHKVSKQFGWQDGDKEYIDELVQKEYDKMAREEQKDK